MEHYKKLFENNQRWIATRLEADPEYFDRLSETQHPQYLYIGCSDSRVTAEEILGLGPGDIFVHRNIANLINSTDLNSACAIEYAVKYLKVKHIIVCGHYNCGGIKAAMQPKDLGILNPWLRSVRDIYRMHKSELNSISDEPLRYDRLAELNVLEQCLNITKIASVQLQIADGGYPKVHGWIFNIRNGEIIDLNFDADKALADIREIYDLTK